MGALLIVLIASPMIRTGWGAMVGRAGSPGAGPRAAEHGAGAAMATIALSSLPLSERLRRTQALGVAMAVSAVLLIAVT